jgi:hypothetical protein
MLIEKSIVKLGPSGACLLIARRFSDSCKLQARDKFRLVIVGGGSGGLTIASKLKKTLGENNVAVVDPSDWHCKNAFLFLNP